MSQNTPSFRPCIDRYTHSEQGAAKAATSPFVGDRRGGAGGLPLSNRTAYNHVRTTKHIAYIAAAAAAAQRHIEVLLTYHTEDSMPPAHVNPFKTAPPLLGTIYLELAWDTFCSDYTPIRCTLLLLHQVVSMPQFAGFEDDERWRKTSPSVSCHTNSHAIRTACVVLGRGALELIILF